MTEDIKGTVTIDVTYDEKTDQPKGKLVDLDDLYNDDAVPNAIIKMMQALLKEDLSES